MQKKWCRGPFLGRTMGYKSLGKEAQENGHNSKVFMVFEFWWGLLGWLVCDSPPEVEEGVG